MVRQHILDALSPCGLSCEKCFAYENGAIRELSSQLKDKLGNFGIYAKRFETIIGNPIFKKYPEFRDMLAFLAEGTCKGCRKQECEMYRNCGVRYCHQEKGLDYCHECDDFPCDRTGFDEHLQVRWIALNRRIREVGIERYYEETRDTPRYV